MTSPILLLAGRFLLASALLMALYWVVWRKQATHRAKRAYLLSMPIVALAIALLQVEVYKPKPIVVEVASAPTLSHHEKGVDYPVQIFPPLEKNFFLTEKKSEAGNTLTERAETGLESNTLSTPLQEDKKGWFTTLSLNTLIGIAYAIIVLLLCIPFVVNLVQLRQLRRKVSVINHEANNICVLMGKVVEAPFSFHRSIFMPLSLTEAQRRMILTHERAHILHRHYLDVWVAEAMTRLLWWNPFLWWARAELRNVHEFEADADVLTSGEDVYAYQSILIEEVLHGDVVIANGFNHSFIRRRFIEMLQSSNRHMTTLGKAGSMAWMLLIGALMCCTMGEAETIYKEVETSSNISQEGMAEHHEEPAITEHTERTKSTTSSDVSLPTLEEKKDETTDQHGGIPKEMEALFEIQGTMAEALGGLFKSMLGSLTGVFTPLTKETYDSLLSLFPLDQEAPSLEEINQQLELLRDSIQMAMNTLHPTLKLGEEVEVPMKVYEEPITISYEEPIIIDEFTTYEAPVRDLEIERKNTEKFRSVAKLLSNWTHIASNPNYKFSTEEYEIAKKMRPDLPSEAEAIKSEEYVGIVRGLYMEHVYKELNDRDITNQVNNELSRFNLNNFKGREIAFIIDFGQQFALYWKGTNTMAFRWTLIPIVSDVNEKLKDDDPLFYFMSSWFQLSESVKLLSKEEYEEASKSSPMFPSYSDYVEEWLKNIYFYHNQMKKSLSLMDKKMRSIVERFIKHQGWVIPRGRTLNLKFEHDGNTWEIEKKSNGGLTMNGSVTTSNSGKTYSEEELENFISPQWGLGLPVGYIRLTEYKEIAKINATARKQYDQLMNCIRNAQALRKEALTNAFGKKHSRYVTVEESVKENIRKLFQDANIERLELGAYLLPDGTKVIEDDRLNLMPQSVNYHHETTDRSALLRNQAPTMERDKSPNYDAHNEQTWPVYTNVQKVSREEYNQYKNEPQVFRGKDCTYVVKYYAISFDFHWFHPNSKDMLVDRKTDDQYMIRYVEHFPLDTYLWIHGQKGEYIRMVSVFPPLPKEVTTVDFIPGETPAKEKLSNASPYEEYKKLKVQTLDKNENIVY